MIVDTLAISIVLYASLLTSVVGSVYFQTNAQSAATNNSKIMPPAPTNIRCHLLGRLHALDASTYGAGTNTRNMMPSSCTSPPNRLHENACPSSWINLISTNVAHSHGQFPGSIAFCAAVCNRGHSGAIAAHAAMIVTTHTTAPNLLSATRITGIHRTR